MTNSTDPLPTTHDPRPAKRWGGYAAIVAAGILLSRIAGLVRTAVMAHYLGASRGADAFNVASKVPNFLQNLLGEGVLSASFIPVYARLLARGEEKLAGRVAGVFVSFLALGVSFIVLIGVLVTPVILAITAPGLDAPTRDLAIRCTRIVFPGVGMLVLFAWALGVLNAHRQFFVSYVAPVLWNLAQIAVLFAFGASLNNNELAVALAWGMFAGCALQFGIQIPFLMRFRHHFRFGLDRTLEPVRQVFRNIVPVVGGRGVVQISSYVDTFIASLLGSGAISMLTYAQAMYLAPISIFGMSVAAAELPAMSSQIGTDDDVRTALRRRLDRGVRQIAFFVVPTIAAFLFLGRLLVAALYQRGKLFTHDTTLIVWYTLIGATVGLLVSTQSRLYSSAFYALHDPKTPFRIAMVRVVIGSTLGALFAFPLRPMFLVILDALRLPKPATHLQDALGVIGITTATGLAAWVEYVLLRRSMTQRIGPGESKAAFFAKLWIAALSGAAGAIAVDRFFGRKLAASLPLAHVSEALIASLVFGVLYFAVAFVLGVPEVRATLSRFTRRG